MTATTTTAKSARMRVGDAALAARLRKALRGDVLFDAGSRGRYSTDASIYQIEPLGVAVPETEQDLINTLTNGRTAAMPVLAPALGGDEGVDNMVQYVKSLSGGEMNAAAQAAQPLFAAMCSACHGMDGKGNKIFGAPNLTDDVWLYGGSDAAIRETIVGGRNGMMPAHGELLGPNRTKILAAYVLSLSQN